MSRQRVGLFLLLALPWPAADAAPNAPAPIVVSFVEHAAGLVRDTALYRAGRGVALRENDMLAANGGVLQLEAGDATIALGPAARVFIGAGGELILLEGWLKLASRAGQAPALATSGVRLASAGTTVTHHAAGGATEIFAESGDALVRDLTAGRPGPATRLAQEQYAMRGAAPGLRLAPRPPAAFLAAMPPGFRDALVPLATGAAAAPRRERQATYAELAPWLAGQPALRRRLRQRFDPQRAAPDAPQPPSPSATRAMP